MAHLNAIVAMSENRVIGADGKIPWHLPEDFRWFKQRTQGSSLIMGRKTCDSLPGPLPQRENLVLTRDAAAKRAGFDFFTEIDALLSHLDSYATGWVIGGSEIYRLLLPRCERLYLTLVKRKAEGNVVMPSFEEKFSRDQIIHENSDFRVERWLNQEIPTMPPAEAWPLIRASAGSGRAVPDWG